MAQWPWYIWALLSALFAGLTALLGKLGTVGIDSNWAAAIRTSFVLMLMWIIVGVAGPRRPGPLLWSSWGWLLLSGLATGGSWLCYFRALSTGPVSRVAALDKLSVVFATLLAVLLLGERIGWVQGCGVLLIVAGAVLLALK